MIAQYIQNLKDCKRPERQFQRETRHAVTNLLSRDTESKANSQITKYKKRDAAR